MADVEIIMRWMAGLVDVRIPDAGSINPWLVIFLAGIVIGALWAQGRAQH